MPSHFLEVWGIGWPFLLGLLVLMARTWSYAPALHLPDKVEQIRRRRFYLQATPLQRFPSLLQAGNANG